MYINNYPPYRYIVFTQCLHIKTSIDHSFLIRSRSGLLRTEVCRSVSQNHGTLSWSWRYWSFSSFYSIHFLVFDSFPVKVVVEHSDHISSDTQGETLGGVLWILSRTDDELFAKNIMFSNYSVYKVFTFDDENKLFSCKVILKDTIPLENV